MAEAMQLAVGGILTRLDSSDLTQQLADLALVLSLSESTGGIRHMPEGVADWAQELRRQQSRDFDLTRSFATLQDDRYALEPVLQREGDSWQLAYSELLFRLPQEMEGSISVQELVLALERNNNIHLLDQLMLRRAIALLREPEGTHQQLGGEHLSGELRIGETHQSAVRPAAFPASGGASAAGAGGHRNSPGEPA